MVVNPVFLATVVCLWLITLGHGVSLKSDHALVDDVTVDERPEKRDAEISKLLLPRPSDIHLCFKHSDCKESDHVCYHDPDLHTQYGLCISEKFYPKDNNKTGSDKATTTTVAPSSKPTSDSVLKAIDTWMRKRTTTTEAPRRNYTEESGGYLAPEHSDYEDAEKSVSDAKSAGHRGAMAGGDAGDRRADKSKGRLRSHRRHKGHRNDKGRGSGRDRDGLKDAKEAHDGEERETARRHRERSEIEKAKGAHDGEERETEREDQEEESMKGRHDKTDSEIEEDAHDEEEKEEHDGEDERDKEAHDGEHRNEETREEEYSETVTKVGKHESDDEAEMETRKLERNRHTHRVKGVLHGEEKVSRRRLFRKGKGKARRRHRHGDGRNTERKKRMVPEDETFDEPDTLGAASESDTDLDQNLDEPYPESDAALEPSDDVDDVVDAADDDDVWTWRKKRSAPGQFGPDEMFDESDTLGAASESDRDLDQILDEPYPESDAALEPSAPDDVDDVIDDDDDDVWTSRKKRSAPGQFGHMLGAASESDTDLDQNLDEPYTDLDAALEPSASDNVDDVVDDADDVWRQKRNAPAQVVYSMPMHNNRQPAQRQYFMAKPGSVKANQNMKPVPNGGQQQRILRVQKPQATNSWQNVLKGQKLVQRVSAQPARKVLLRGLQGVGQVPQYRYQQKVVLPEQSQAASSNQVPVSGGQAIVGQPVLSGAGQNQPKFHAATIPRNQPVFSRHPHHVRYFIRPGRHHGHRRFNGPHPVANGQQTPQWSYQRMQRETRRRLLSAPEAGDEGPEETPSGEGFGPVFHAMHIKRRLLSAPLAGVHDPEHDSESGEPGAVFHAKHIKRRSVNLPAPYKRKANVVTSERHQPIKSTELKPAKPADKNATRERRMNETPKDATNVTGAIIGQKVDDITTTSSPEPDTWLGYFKTIPFIGDILTYFIKFFGYDGPSTGSDNVIATEATSTGHRQKRYSSKTFDNLHRTRLVHSNTVLTKSVKKVISGNSAVEIRTNEIHDVTLKNQSLANDTRPRDANKTPTKSTRLEFMTSTTADGLSTNATTASLLNTTSSRDESRETWLDYFRKIPFLGDVLSYFMKFFGYDTQNVTPDKGSNPTPAGYHRVRRYLNLKEDAPEYAVIRQTSVTWYNKIRSPFTALSDFFRTLFRPGGTSKEDRSGSEVQTDSAHHTPKSTHDVVPDPDVKIAAGDDKTRQRLRRNKPLVRHRRSSKPKNEETPAEDKEDDEFDYDNDDKSTSAPHIRMVEAHKKLVEYGSDGIEFDVGDPVDLLKRKHFLCHPDDVVCLRNGTRKIPLHTVKLWKPKKPYSLNETEFKQMVNDTKETKDALMKLELEVSELLKGQLGDLVAGEAKNRKGQHGDFMAGEAKNRTGQHGDFMAGEAKNRKGQHGDFMAGKPKNRTGRSVHESWYGDADWPDSDVMHGYDQSDDFYDRDVTPYKDVSGYDESYDYYVIPEEPEVYDVTSEYEPETDIYDHDDSPYDQNADVNDYDVIPYYETGTDDYDHFHSSWRKKRSLSSNTGHKMSRRSYKVEDENTLDLDDGSPGNEMGMEVREEEEADTDYSEWGQWQPCSVTCGQGFRQRSRSCRGQRKHCEHGNMERELCRMTECGG